jgi:hypothetical protein
MTPPDATRRREWHPVMGWLSPSRSSQALVVAVTLLAFAVCFHGLRVDFFRSEQWSRAPIVVSFALSALLYWYPGRARLFDRFYNPNSLRARRLLVWVIEPALIYMFFWAAFAGVLPDTFTRVAGTTFLETHDLRKEHSYKRRTCDYRILGAPFARGNLRNYYCSWPTEYQRLPDQGLMVVRGRETWFGRHVEAVEPLK